MNMKEPVIDEIQGIKVSDPYRWLEDTKDADVKKWIEEQNALVDSTLKNDLFRTFSEELITNFNITSSSNPSPVKGRYFYSERKQGEDQAVLYVKKGLNGVPVEIFNPNGKRDGNTITIDYWNESATGKYIAYGVSQGGDELATIHIQNIETNITSPEVIMNCRHSSIRWLPDDSAFFYTRNPRPGMVPKDEQHLHAKVYMHKVGQNPDTDVLIFGEGRGKDDMINLSLSPDGKYLAISVRQKWTENEIYIYDTETKKTEPLIIGISSEFGLSFLRDKILVNTNYKADKNRVLWTTYADFFKPIAEWREFIPERDHVIEAIRVTNSKILVEYLVNACSEVIIFDYNGAETGKIPLPACSSLANISCRRDEEEFFYGVESFTFPKIIYRYDPGTLAYVEYQRTASPITPDDYEVKQEWCASKDSTKVPVFIFHKKGLPLNGLNSTILYGYGGFGMSETPTFLRNWVPWISRGGVFAVANIRGGGEFGSDWHKGGIKDKKQNSFDDFIAASEHLISKKYTSSRNLGILGGSNGGLLVSAVGVQRPDLFKAICSRVPLTDMVRFSKFGMAIRWIHEYGNPAVKEDLENILKWSPYHNVKKGKRYPDFLITTAEKDTRVEPLHARKMAAALQDANAENKALLFTEKDAGHGAGKPITKIVESQALALSFFAERLGLRM